MLLITFLFVCTGGRGAKGAPEVSKDTSNRNAASPALSEQANPHPPQSGSFFKRLEFLTPLKDQVAFCVEHILFFACFFCLKLTVHIKRVSNRTREYKSA